MNAVGEIIDLRTEAEVTLQSALSAIAALERIAAVSPSAVRSTGYFLAEASDRLAALVAKLEQGRG